MARQRSRDKVRVEHRSDRVPPLVSMLWKTIYGERPMKLAFCAIALFTSLCVSIPKSNIGTPIGSVENIKVMQNSMQQSSERHASDQVVPYGISS
ncbi:uncharacterized protein MEPE_05180 [Melanopsichium pennsylvanicum]|uniref:Uncharacterized protein n=1 Tax=Melanopsichium pennsylvanicum TaxID=63383 RepID=A0AAJ4XRA1_9BASI|nr:uncharacterized protein MEPE_05180 [Melanopsichium pennsylvanicum]